MKRALILFLAMTMIFFLISCGNNIIYSVAYEGKGTFGNYTNDSGGVTFGMLEIVSSRDELVSLCEKYNNNYFNENSEFYNNEIPETVRSFDDVFFESHSLVICEIVAGNYCSYKISKIIKVEDNLQIVIKEKRKTGTYTDVAFMYLFLLELEKDDVLNIKSDNLIVKYDGSRKWKR